MGAPASEIWTHWTGTYKASTGGYILLTAWSQSFTGVNNSAAFSGSVISNAITVGANKGKFANGVVTWLDGTTWTWLSTIPVVPGTIPWARDFTTTQGAGFMKGTQSGNTYLLDQTGSAYQMGSFRLDYVNGTECSAERGVYLGSYSKGQISWVKGALRFLWTDWTGSYVANGETVKIKQLGSSVSGFIGCTAFTGSVKMAQITVGVTTGTFADGAITWSNGTIWSWVSF